MPVVRIRPSEGGDLITTESEAAVDVNNYTVKRNFRRVALKEEGRREGDTLFRPNIDVEAASQYNLPDTGGEEITLLETARHPDGTVALIVGTPTRLFRFSESTSGLEVHWGETYTGATGDDADPEKYPVYGVEIKSALSGPKEILFWGDWYWTGLVGQKIVVTNSGSDKGFDVVTAALEASGEAGTYFGNITGVTQPSSDLVFAVDVDPTTDLSVGGTFVVSGTTSYEGSYTVKSLAAGSITVHAGVFTSTENGWAFSESGANTRVSVNDGVYDEDGSLSNDLITEISAGDFVTGPSGILPVYSSTEAGRWSLINPRVRPNDPVSPDYIFSTDGHRWEMVNVGGTVVFNNGVDLPVSYNIKTQESNFLYELREAGYAFVDTIAEFNGMLVVMDIGLLSSDAYADLLNRSAVDGIFSETGPFGRFTDENQIDRISYRLINSAIDEVQRYGVGIEGNMTTGSGDLDLPFGVYSFETGTELHIPEAGPAIGYTTWANATYYGLGIIVEYSGKLYITKNAGISSGANPNNDIGVDWEEISTSEYEDLITDVVGPFSGFLKFDLGSASLGNYFECYVAGTLARIEEGTDFNAGDSNTVVRDAMKTKLDSLALAGYTFSTAGTDTILITTTSDYWATAYELDDNSTILFSNGARFTVANTASNTVTDAIVQRNENFELSPEPSFYDLSDENSGIIRAMELKSRLVIWKDDIIYVASYTGVANDPFSFEKVYQGNDSIFWRWCLSRVDGEYFVYPGKNRFYRFDLVTKSPRPMTKLGLCDNLFYDYSTVDQMERTYSAVNAVTREVWFVIPEAPVDKVLAWDFEYDTCSTIDKHYSAASTIDSVIEVVQFGPSTVLFVMGTSDGVLLTYGMSDVVRVQLENSKHIYSREGVYEPDLLNWVDRVEYDSTFRSGLNSITQEFDEIILKSLGIIYSSLTVNNPNLNATLFSTINPSQTKEQLFSVDLTSMGIENTVQAYFIKNYYQDQVIITGFDYAGISSRIFSFDPIDSQSVNRDSDA